MTTTGQSTTTPDPGRPGFLNRLLPVAGHQRRVAAANLVNSIGSGLYSVTSALYFTRIVGLSITQVAAGLSGGALLGLLAAAPMGYLADRLGARRVYVAAMGVAATAMVAFTMVRTFWQFLAVAFCSGLAMAAGQAAGPPIVRQYGGPDIVTFRAYLRSVVNLGYGIGALLSVVAVQGGSRHLYLGILLLNSFSYLACAVVMLSLPRRTVEVTRPAGGGWVALRDRPYAVVSLLSGMMALHMALLTFALPLWIIQHGHTPHWLASGAVALNTLIVVVLQVRVGRGVDTVPAAGRAMRTAGFLVLGGMAVLALLPALNAWLGAVAVAGGVLVYTLGELWQVAGTMELNYGLALPHLQGQYSGVFTLGQGAAYALSPAVLGAMCLQWGATGWLVMGVALAVLGALAPRVAVWAESTRPREATPGIEAEEPCQY
ncbi:MFS transporter [Kitasatospora kazusensis]|uniref:MFS transporter n=1 Tax=Kitasatospora kazusensis TaxID=407974 RepID=A0ABN2ZB20_9ACTN